MMKLKANGNELTFTVLGDWGRDGSRQRAVAHGLGLWSERNNAEFTAAIGKLKPFTLGCLLKYLICDLYKQLPFYHTRICLMESFSIVITNTYCNGQEETFSSLSLH